MAEFPVDKLLDAALALPKTTRGISCPGTKLERPTAQVKGKAFLFVGPQDLRVKLNASLKDATADPRCTVGAGGWVKATPGVPMAKLKAWIRESHAVMGG